MLGGGLGDGKGVRSSDMAKTKPPKVMHDDLIARIKAFVESHPPPKLPEDAMFTVDELRQFGFAPRELFPKASKKLVTASEMKLGFPLPELLRRIYTEISNGIAGFSCEIMGLPGGCASSGSIVEAYQDFRKGGEPPHGSEREWRIGLLPFCDWGCCIYSCVDCIDPAHPIFTHEDSGVYAERFTLPAFFEMWLKGKIEWSQEGVEYIEREGINPFTRKKETFTARVRKPRP